MMYIWMDGWNVSVFVCMCICMNVNMFVCMYDDDYDVIYNDDR